jgi:hypothetical protein
MKTAPVFQAAFADFKLIKGRKTAQFIFEVPTESSDAALDVLGGVPKPHKEAWVAIALLDMSKVAAATPAPLEGKEGVERVRRKFADMPMPSQAALRCDDLEFQAFLRSVNADVCNADTAANVVRDLLGVKSRAEIRPDTPAGRGWLELDRQFQEWRHATA